MGLDSGTTAAYQGMVDRAIERARTAPRPLSSGTAQRVQRNVERFFEAMLTHGERHAKVATDERLSPKAIAADRQRYRRELEQEAAGLISDTRARVESYLAATKEAMRPDNAPSEDRLANARADAKMALDGTPGDQLDSTLADLATSSDAAMTHLLLLTPWVEYYALGRRDAHLPTVWATTKERLMAEVLDDEGMRAFQSLDAAEDLAEVPGRLREALWFYLKDTGLPLPDRAHDLIPA